jgi:glycosyltransferase involved in cell wall biosynthesis
VSDDRRVCVLMDQIVNARAGTEGQVLKLVEGLSSRGWEVDFAVLRSSELTRSQDFPVATTDLGIGSIADPRSWVRLRSFGARMRARGVRLVQAVFNDASVLGPPMLRATGHRVVISRRDMGFWYTPAYRTVLPVTGRFVDAAVCNSQAVAEVTQQVEKIPAERIHVIYNGYAERPVPVATTDADAPPVYGIVANLRPIKRIEDAIRALPRVRERVPRTKLHLVGAGDPSPYRALAESLGVAEHVVFFGGRSDAEDLIADFDVGVLCSESEGFSNAIIEYLRAGKPVVCTRTGGNPEVVQDEVNGHLVGVGDVDALADRISGLLAEPDRRARLGAEGRRLVEERFGLSVMLDRYEELYRSLLEPRARR